MHVEAGSSVALRCIVTHAMLRPKFVFWYRDRHGLSNSRSSYAKDSITITDNINEKYDLTVGGDRVVIGAPINVQENKATNNIDETEPITYNDGDDSPTRDDISYTEDISESLAC